MYQKRQSNIDIGTSNGDRSTSPRGMLLPRPNWCKNNIFRFTLSSLGSLESADTDQHSHPLFSVQLVFAESRFGKKLKKKKKAGPKIFGQIYSV